MLSAAKVLATFAPSQALLTLAMPCCLAMLLSGKKRGRSSVVEHQLPKLSVEGSIPFARSKKIDEAVK
jgi:hypothetical protein